MPAFQDMNPSDRGTIQDLLARVDALERMQVQGEGVHDSGQGSPGGRILGFTARPPFLARILGRALQNDSGSLETMARGNFYGFVECDETLTAGKGLNTNGPPLFINGSFPAMDWNAAFAPAEGRRGDGMVANYSNLGGADKFVPMLGSAVEVNGRADVPPGEIVLMWPSLNGEYYFDYRSEHWMGSCGEFILSQALRIIVETGTMVPASGLPTSLSATLNINIDLPPLMATTYATGGVAQMLATVAYEYVLKAFAFVGTDWWSSSTGPLGKWSAGFIARAAGIPIVCGQMHRVDGIFLNTGDVYGGPAPPEIFGGGWCRTIDTTNFAVPLNTWDVFVRNKTGFTASIPVSIEGFPITKSGLTGPNEGFVAEMSFDHHGLGVGGTGIAARPCRVIANNGFGPQYNPASAGVPVANFTASATTGAAPLSVTFTNTSTNAPTYADWHFGDGESVLWTAGNPVHVYKKPGKYSVYMRCQNTKGSDHKYVDGMITVT